MYLPFPKSPVSSAAPGHFALQNDGRRRIYKNCFYQNIPPIAKETCQLSSSRLYEYPRPIGRGKRQKLYAKVNPTPFFTIKLLELQADFIHY